MVFRQSPDYRLVSQAAAAAFAAARLLHFHLRPRFPFLFSYLLVVAFCSFVLSTFAAKSHVYYWTYLTAEPVTWCVAALAVREMFALIFRDYPGLRTAGRWALYAALAASVVASAAIATLFSPGGSHSNRLFYHQVFDRSFNLSLTVIIVILMIFLSKYPLHLDRNTYVASGFFSALFLLEAAVKLIDSLSPHLAVSYVDYADVGFSALCFLGWGIMLQPASAPAPAKAPANKPREAELLQQLETMNRILSRSGKR